MRFFKYLIFVFISTLSFSVYSATVYYFNSKPNDTFPSASAACAAYPALFANDPSSIRTELDSNGITCRAYRVSSGSYTGAQNVLSKEVPDKCPPYGYPAHFIGLTDGGIAVKRCVKQSDGSFCSYSDHGKKPFLVTIPGTDSPGRNLYSDGENTVSSCYESDNGSCNPNDPYGGCFQPADDGCTRQFDGSIVCPEDKEPPIEQGCNGADYCKRPPQGCGEGYVSGTFNGERICIKSKPSDGGGSDGGGSDGGGSDGGGSDGGGSDGGGSDGGGSDGGGSDGGGSDGGGSDGGGSDGGGSDGGAPPDLPVTTDLSGVINAIKNVASKIDHYSKETIESIDTMSKKITGKLDTSNGHLDQIEANTLSTKNNTAETNDLLQQILDKTGLGDGSTGDGSGDGSTGDGSGDGSTGDGTGDGVDLTETNGLLGEIRDGINDINNVFSDEGKTELEQIGQPSNDPRYSNAEANAQASLNNLANKLTFGSSACVSDFEIQLPIFGSINIALSQWCSLLALIKILFQLVVLLTCLRMLDATVRTI